MSQKRQTAIFNSLGDRRSHITTLTHDYRAGHVVPLHFHDRDQLVYGSRGVMTVQTGEGAWVVPTHRAVLDPCVGSAHYNDGRDSSDENSAHQPQHYRDAVA